MRVALIGNPNCGKTTLFNLLTGMNAKIGNWPGVTIEKKVGYIKDTRHELVDLPGIYSLSPYSLEEEISRKYLFDENVDVILNVIDGTCLERSLYLTTQLLELDTKVIVLVNMADILEKKGVYIDIKKLSDELKTDVIKVSALKGTGINEVKGLLNANQTERKNYARKYDDVIESFLYKIENILNKRNIKNSKFIAVNLLSEDRRFNSYLTLEISEYIKSLKRQYKQDIEEVIATQRYNYIDKVNSKVLVRKIKRHSISDTLDKIFLNKFLSFPIFLLIMGLIYYLSVGLVGSRIVESISIALEGFKRFVEIILINYEVSNMITSLILDGILTGIISVITFLPQLIILFFCIALLENTGYMSRVALFLDKYFRKVGLSGKSLIPFIIGSGCSVPGIMGTRIIENQDEKRITTILTPFVPCSAKLPIISLFIGSFFPENKALMTTSLYLFAVMVIIISAYILSRFFFKNVSTTYIAELPEYKLPNIKYILSDVKEKTISFIKRASSIILVSSIVVWYLSSFSIKLEYGVEIENSILAMIGKSISIIFYPMLGVNSWELAVSAIQGIIAKEQVVSSLNIIGNLSELNLSSIFTKSSAYAFVVFNLFSAPCIAAISAMKKELGKVSLVLKALIFQISIAWVLAVGVYQIGIRLENAKFNLIDIILIIFIISIIVVLLMKQKCKNNNCQRCPYSTNCVTKSK